MSATRMNAFTLQLMAGTRWLMAGVLWLMAGTLWLMAGTLWASCGTATDEAATAADSAQQDTALDTAADSVEMPDVVVPKDLGADNGPDVPETTEADTVDIAAPPKTPTWTVLVYMASDNNLEKSGITDIAEMMEVSTSEHLNLLVQVDRAEEFYTLGIGGLPDWTGTKRLRVTHDTVTELSDLGELNMGTSETLSDFITWGVTSYPADNVMLILWNHGHAWRGFGGDDFDADQLTAGEIVQGIKEGMDQSGLESFALMGFDACLMADLVTVQAFQFFTRHLIVSEEFEPSHGWNYEAFEELAKDPWLSPIEVGEAILDGYRAQAKQKKKHHIVTLSLLDLEQVPALVDAWDALIAHVSATDAETVTRVGAARANVQTFGYSPTPENDYNMIDMGHFGTLLAADDPAVEPLSEALDTVLDSMVLGLVQGDSTANATGVSVYFPALREYYESAFDGIAGTADLRSFLLDFHSGAEQLDAPAFQLANAPTGPVGLVKSGCAPGGSVTSSSELDEAQSNLASQASLHVGFIGADGKPRIVRRIDAAIDSGGSVHSAWDQHVLSVRQGERHALVFAETRLDGAFATHEIPLLVAGPAPCPCVLPGDPGFFDTDGDGLGNCVDEDQDGDGIPEADGADNCPFVPNPAQADTDRDGVGDACAVSTNAPTLGCDPDPESLFGPTRAAVLRVVTHRVQKSTESQSLYVQTEVGVSEVEPLPGMLYVPMVLEDGGAKGWTWAAGPPLLMRPDKGLEFSYQPIDDMLVTDEFGTPQVDDAGQAITLKAAMGLGEVYIELRVANAAGAGDHAAWEDDDDDLAACEPMDPNWCADGQMLDCNADCRPAARRGDGVCDDGSDGADFNCQVFGFDGGDCQVPDCPGAAGYIRDCNGNCYARPEQVGDGVCHDGSNPALPKLSCDSFDYDGGDCPCGDNCSGNGTCVDGICECSGGYTGPYCGVAPTCGNGTCEGWENCKLCPADCGACPDPCGDGICKAGAGEDCDTCPADCGQCACGDGYCSPGTESCESCPTDCGACPECGDQVCSPWSANAPFPVAMGENCATCPIDCGACQGECCEPSDGPSGVWNTGGGCGDQAIAACVCAKDPSCCVFGWPSKCQAIAEAECGLECCVPDCTGKECGLDGCGGLCGACVAGEVCEAGLCECDASEDADNDGLGDYCDPCPNDPGNDDDLDGLCAAEDNCDAVPNPNQEDLDGDGHGDVCDSDDDSDGVPDTLDNCPTKPNADQKDTDTDGKGDACDPDLDGDGVPNLTDNCPLAPNPDLSDEDSDGLGDVCDGDDDGDTVPDASDNCPMTPNAQQTDTDSDGKGDRCDDDDDNDGVADATDNCPLLPNPLQLDTESDGLGDACDSDDDGDSVEDAADNCPLTFNPTQTDSDDDGLGDPCDL